MGKKREEVFIENQEPDAIPDANGFIQNHPDASGFAPGKQPEKDDGKWRSNYPDANGWHHSSTD